MLCLCVKKNESENASLDTELLEQDPRVVGLSMWSEASDVLLIFTKYHPKLKSEALEWGPTCLRLLPSSHVH